MRLLVASSAIVTLLAACAGPVPDSGRGVGFSNYSEFERQRAEREAALTGVPVVDETSAQPTPLNSGTITSEELAAVGIGQSQGVGAPLSAISVPQPAPETGRIAGVEASPDNPAPELASNPAISDEQDFSAVSSRESIESDAERRAAQAAARQQIEPTALPEWKRNDPLATNPKNTTDPLALQSSHPEDDQKTQTRSTFKNEKERKQKKNFDNETNWNYLFMNPDAINAAMADKLNLTKGELLDRDN